MNDETPQWALDKAAKAGGYNDYATAKRMCMAGSVIRNSIEAHAATLAKYETEPVDPVLVKARELRMAKDTLKGAAGDAVMYKYDADDAIMAALRLPAMGDDK